MNKRSWVQNEAAPAELIAGLPEFPPLAVDLLYGRGYRTKDEILGFVRAETSGRDSDPFLMKDIEAAVGRIVHHIKTGDKICVYGDYDADGVTASALLVEILATLGAKVESYLPDRVSEGYSLNCQALDTIAAGGVKLVMTVDTGIRNRDEVAYGRGLGLDIIVTDHHLPPETREDYPDCLIVNPRQMGDDYPEKSLAGVGVAFKVAQALIMSSKLEDEIKERLIERSTDLVAIGTIADCVPLLGENRSLVRRGLAVLKLGRRPGVRALVRAAAIDLASLDSWNVAFQIAPRLNAAGRMERANAAFEILVTRDDAEAKALANNLQVCNQERQQATEAIYEEIVNGFGADGPRDKIIVAVSPSVHGRGDAWNEGLVGLVAGRLAEKYWRPALVITSGHGQIKGSGRSAERLNMVKMLEEAKAHLTKYGGHANACGFAMETVAQLEGFAAAVQAIAARDVKDEDRPSLKIDALLPLEAIGESALEAIGLLAPFGQGNIKPRLAAFGVTVVDRQHMGMNGQHLKLRLKTDGSSVISALAFSQSGNYSEASVGALIDVAYYLEANEFNGRREMVMKIVDLRLHSA